jgi:hypothetical protein
MKLKAVLAIVLILTTFNMSCTTSWVQVALNDLPVLIQIATAIISFFPAASQDAAVVAQISTQAQADLNLILSLYNDYKSTPTPTTLAKIQAAIADAQTNLPALLQAAHISNPALVQKVTAAVNIILTTIAAISALIPVSAAGGFKAISGKATVPSASDLKKAWAQQVCAGDATCSALVK